MKKFLFLILLSFYSLAHAQNAGRTIIDDLGRKIYLKGTPSRVISIAPSITEIIFALGEESKLIGRSNFCDYPAGAKNIKSIGNIIDPNYEMILALEPDIVIVSTHFQRSSIDKLEKYGINVAAFFSEESFSGLHEIIGKIGGLLDCKKKSDDLINKLKKREKEVLSKPIKSKREVALYYVIAMGREGDFTASGSSYIGKFIKMAGAKNIAENLDGWKYSLEQIITHDPDIIICPKTYGYKEMFTKLGGYSSLRAVKNGDIYEIDNNRLDRLTPRTLDGLEELIDIVNGYKKKHD
jgi:iron complex transport system substrate-binding protein